MLRVENLCAGYGPTRVLWDVGLAVEEHETVIIAGSNGAGKSTLLKCIAGVMEPQAGAITFKEQRIEGRPAYDLVARGLSLIPEGGRVFPHMSVADNLQMGAHLLRDRAARQAALDSVYHLFADLYEKRNQYARTLSGGQRQMLAIGIGLMSRPALLMVDEPSSGLSPLLVGYLMDMLTKVTDSGLSVLLVEQNIRSALEIADRGYVMENGRIIMEGTSSALKENDFVREAYLGL
ncbi:MAG: ABC transporter ATP-binding protein [Thermoleophilia bacterium]|nr:ABC transporter ATP-binding protein [Thermoleophilia bacterium]